MTDAKNTRTPKTPKVHISRGKRPDAARLSHFPRSLSMTGDTCLMFDGEGSFVIFNVMSGERVIISDSDALYLHRFLGDMIAEGKRAINAR